MTAPDTAAAPGLLTGLIGRGIQASRSPSIHQREADALGLRLVYSCFDFDAKGWGDDRLEPLLSALALAGFRGVNVTFPFKQAIIPLLDRLSPEAAAIGAVNTVVFGAEGTVGHNTDVTGFAQGLREQMPSDRLDRVLQIGAGGAGSAAAWAMMEMGVGTLTIVETDAERRTALCDALGERFGADRIVSRADLTQVPSVSGIVNTTPVGMAKLPGMPVDPAILATRPWVYDVIYFPAETELLRAARAAGCVTINGVTMVLHQAAAAFELFTGRRADVDRMRRTQSFPTF